MTEKNQLGEKDSEHKKADLLPRPQKSDFSLRQSTAVDQLLYLQRTVGNQAVQHLVKSGTLQAKQIASEEKNRQEQETGRLLNLAENFVEPKAMTHPKAIKEETIKSKSTPVGELLEKKSPSGFARVVFKEIRWNYYDITANTLKESAKVIKEKGDQAGTTEWKVDATWKTKDGRIVDTTVTVSVVVTLPRWRAVEKQPQKVKKEWNRFLDALKEHEMGHVDIVKTTSKDLANKLLGANEDIANSIVQTNEQERVQVGEEYDKNTDHGRRAKNSTIIDLTVES